MKNLSSLLIFIMLFCSSAFAQKNVAVLEIERHPDMKREISAREARIITDAIRGEARKILPRNQYSVMTTESIMAMGDAVLAECAENNCIIDIGRKIDAEYVVRGMLSKIQTTFTLSIEIFETEYGNLEATSGLIRGRNMMELLDKSEAACATLFRYFLGAGVQTVVPTPAPALVTPPPAPVAPQPVVPSSPSLARTQTPTAPPASTSVSTRGTFTDLRDGKTYRTVIMPDGKTWMAENLNFATSSGSWCYDNNSANCNTHGRLYDWNTARVACPVGWHLPTDTEWTALRNAVGSSAGKKLKSTSGWNRNGNGTDEYGFSALPSGYRWAGGGFNNVGSWWGSWSATEYDESYAGTRLMFFNYEDVFRRNFDKTNGFSVRCVKND